MIESECTVSIFAQFFGYVRFFKVSIFRLLKFISPILKFFLEVKKCD